MRTEREYVMHDESNREICRVMAKSRRAAMSKCGVDDGNLHLYCVTAASRFVALGDFDRRMIEGDWSPESWDR